MMQTSVEDTLIKIIRGSRFEGNVYLVGGYVRDCLLGVSPKDLDLCIDYPNGTDEFLNYLKSVYFDICSDFVEFPRYKTGKFTLRVNNEFHEIECVVPRVESYNNGPRKPSDVVQSSILEDSIRRDFCCNALYLNISTGEIIDPTERGIMDCEYRVLRTPCDPVLTFVDDPLRMLRAIRFSVQKGFTIDEYTFSEIKDYPGYYELSMERVNSEFTKILMSGSASKGIRLLKLTGLLKYISPELDHAWGFDQRSKYHSLNLTDHLLKVLDIVVEMSPDASLELRLAALFHDISKATDYQVKEDGGYSFHGHEVSSSYLVKDILKRLKFPTKVIDRSSFLIRSHMALKSTAVLDEITELYTFSIKPKRVRKLIRELGTELIPVLELIEADNLSHDPKYQIKGQKDWFLAKVEEVHNLLPTAPVKEFTLPVNGKDILKYFNRTDSGPWIKEKLIKLQDIYDEFPDLNKEELLSRL